MSTLYTVDRPELQRGPRQRKVIIMLAEVQPVRHVVQKGVPLLMNELQEVVNFLLSKSCIFRRK